MIDEFICASCGGVFERMRPDHEAEAEHRARFPEVSLDECDLVCDDCFKVAMGPQWQRARVNRNAQECPGALLWVRAGKPQRTPNNVDVVRGLRIDAPLVTFQTHLMADDGTPVWVPAKDVELLAEFADDVEPEDFGPWRTRGMAAARETVQ